MKKRALWMMLAVLGLVLFAACSNPSGSSSDTDETTTDTDTTPTFTGTWVRTVSATETMTYVYKDDKTFTYTWIQPNGDKTVYTGTYTYDAATLKYKETVETQSLNDAAPIQGGWETNYSYTLTATTLSFDDGNGYTPTFTKQ